MLYSTVIFCVLVVTALLYEGHRRRKIKNKGRLGRLYIPVWFFVKSRPLSMDYA